MASLRLASFKAGGRASYGAVTDRASSISARSSRNIRRCSTCSARRRSARRGRPRAGAADYQLKDVDDAAADPGAGKDHLRRHQLSGPRRRVQRRPRRRRRISRTCSAASRPRWSATAQPIVRPKVSEQFDYEGEIVLVIGKEGRHIPQDKALSYHRRAHARQRRQRARLAAPRHPQRHPGQELRQLRQPRPLDRAGGRRSIRQSRCGSRRA